MLKASLNLKLGQQLTMTPQLQQAIQLLQLSTLELQTHIQEMLESNPLLSSEEDEATMGPDIDNSSSTDTEASSTDEISVEVEGGWDDLYEQTAPSSLTPTNSSDEFDYLANQSDEEETLIDHLLWQIHLASLNPKDKLIAINLIESLDSDGYLRENLETIAMTISHELGEFEKPEDAEIESVLHFIQHLDPAGCGARTLAECLYVQLEEFPEDTPFLTPAKKLVTSHLDQLGNQQRAQLAQQLRTDEHTIAQAINLIQQLDPKPGSRIGGRPTEYIVPDVFVKRQKNGWRVELNQDYLPRVHINQLYAAMLKRADTSSDNTYIRNQLQEARWFIKSLQSRHETLLKVATAIVENQRGFFEYGEEAMRPLVLRDIAEHVEMHESTISRVTTKKYMHTPQGIFEFKYFFSSHVGTEGGGACSSVAIRAMIRKLIEAENSEKPLSDSKIAAFLEEKGVQVARRTVAKYRESMNIPSSSERKNMILSRV